MNFEWYTVLALLIAPGSIVLIVLAMRGYDVTIHLRNRGRNRRRRRYDDDDCD